MNGSLNNFVMDENLEVLESIISEFNPLKILKIDKYEIRHSNILAWLLNPNENHGLGEKVIKKLLYEILLTNENSSNELTPARVHLMDFSDMFVLREWNNIDILAVSQVNKVVLLMENKIYAKEAKHQLAKYLNKVTEVYPDYIILPVYLTLTGDEPSEGSGYLSYSHEYIFRLLKLVLSRSGSNINEKVCDFLNYYIKTLEVLTMQNDNLVNLCKELYRKHKEAIDMIVTYGSTSSFDLSIDAFKQNTQAVESFRNGKEFWFITEELAKGLPKLNAGWKSPYPVSMFFYLDEKNDNVHLFFEVGPFKNLEKRLEFLKYIRESEDKITESGYTKIKDGSLKVDGRYTKIFSCKVKFDRWEDLDLLTQKMDTIYIKQKKLLNEITQIVLGFDWEGGDEY